jgi:hypothetical protein
LRLSITSRSTFSNCRDKLRPPRLPLSYNVSIWVDSKSSKKNNFKHYYLDQGFSTAGSGQNLYGLWFELDSFKSVKKLVWIIILLFSDRPKPEFKPKPKNRNFGLVWTDTKTETERRSIPKPKPKPKPKLKFLFQ